MDNNSQSINFTVKESASQILHVVASQIAYITTVDQHWLNHETHFVGSINDVMYKSIKEALRI